MALTTGIALASTAWNIGSSIHDRNKRNRAKKQRDQFFNQSIQPLLNKATQGMDDVDFDSIRQAEMKMPILQFQNQMKGLSRGREASLGQSGFSDSGFIQRDFNEQSNMATEGLSAQRFQTDRGILDMQSQLEQMINENRLRAKELEFSYKYG